MTATRVHRPSNRASGADPRRRALRRTARDRRPAARSPPRLVDRPRARSSSSSRVFSATASTRRRPRQQADPLVQRDELGERRDRVALVAVDDRLARPCGRGRSACGALPWISPSVTPEYAGWSSEPCPSTKSSLAAPLDALDDELLGGAGDEVGDDRVDRDPPARDRDPRLAGRHELAADAAAARLAVELERRRSSSRSRSRSRRSRIDVAPCVEVLAGRHVQTREAACAGRAARRRARARAPQLGVVGDELVQAVLDVEPGRDAVLQQLAPRRREAPALRRDADERGRRLEARARRRRSPTTGSRPRVSPARVESRIATTSSGR